MDDDDDDDDDVFLSTFANVGTNIKPFPPHLRPWGGLRKEQSTRYAINSKSIVSHLATVT